MKKILYSPNALEKLQEIILCGGCLELRQYQMKQKIIRMNKREDYICF